MRVSGFRNFAVMAALGGALGTSSLALASASEFISALGSGSAAIVDSAAPIAEAGIGARNDVDLANTYSDLAEYQARSAAAVARYQSDTAATIARVQGQTALDIFRIQQQGINYRLDAQLAALRDARKDSLKFTLAGLQKQWQFQDRYLDIIAMQGKYNERIARLALQYQMTAQGFSNGYSNQGNPLTVTGGNLLNGLGATASPSPGVSATLTVSNNRPGVRIPVGTGARYPGRAHAAGPGSSERVQPLSTHSAL